MFRVISPRRGILSDFGNLFFSLSFFFPLFIIYPSRPFSAVCLRKSGSRQLDDGCGIVSARVSANARVHLLLAPGIRSVIGTHRVFAGNGIGVCGYVGFRAAPSSPERGSRSRRPPAGGSERLSGGGISGMASRKKIATPLPAALITTRGPPPPSLPPSLPTSLSLSPLSTIRGKIRR